MCDEFEFLSLNVRAYFCMYDYYSCMYYCKSGNMNYIKATDYRALANVFI